MPKLVAPLKLQEAYEGTVETLAFGGEGIVRHDKFVIFIPYTVPGDRIRFRVTQVKQSFARGRVESILEPSSFRVTPPCPIYLNCGGCQHQELEYSRSIEEKSRILKSLLEHGLKLDNAPVESPLPCPAPYGYRHKMQVAVGESTDGKLHVGLYQPFTHRIVDMPTCPIQHPLDNELLNVFRETFISLGWEPYDESSNTGLIRHFLTRVNQKEEAYTVLVATRADLPGWESLKDALVKRVPKLQGIAVNVNPLRTNVVLGRETRILWGKPYLEETIDGILFRFGPTSFFQVNPYLLSPITKKILEWLNPSDRDEVLDLYCGVGTFTLPMSKKVGQIVGIEENSDSIGWAKENKKLNSCQNVKFIAGKVEESLRKFKPGQFSHLFLDPPRKGLHPDALQAIIKLNASKILYLSCNPSTLVRDANALIENGWKLTRALAADFFPQTSQIEALALLEK